MWRKVGLSFRACKLIFTLLWQNTWKNQLRVGKTYLDSQFRDLSLSLWRRHCRRSLSGGEVGSSRYLHYRGPRKRYREYITWRPVLSDLFLCAMECILKYPPISSQRALEDKNSTFKTVVFKTHFRVKQQNSMQK